MKKFFTKTLAVALALCILPCQPNFAAAAETGGQDAVAAKAQKEALPQPAYLWNFDSANGNTVANQGTAGQGNATLHGAATTQAAISIGNKTHSAAGNSVLTLSGGSKDTSYVDLPNNLYSGVSADTGLTWSFWMKPNTNVVRYSRLFSSTSAENNMEFAYTPFAEDRVWNLVFDDGAKYFQIHDEEPSKGVWSYVTITISKEKVVFYINGDEAASTCNEGNASVLTSRLNGLASFPNHSLGRTNSTWGDADCAAQLDDVAVYKSVLTDRQVANLARTYGLNPKMPREMQDASEGTYGTDGQALTQIDKLTTASVNGKNIVKLWTDNDGRYYYSVSRDGKVVIECSALGITTKAADLSVGLSLDNASITTRAGEEDYDILQGSASHVNKKYNEKSFALKKGNSKVTIYFRVFDDGMAYRYEVDGDTASATGTTTVTGESSEFMLPDKGTIWTNSVSPTYEGYEYTKSTMESQYKAATKYSTPILASLGEDSGNAWVLLSEANVYNEKEPYCASIYRTEAGKKSMQVTFGRYLKQETDESMDGKSYPAEYDDISEVTMKNVFHTPWRVAIIASDLEGISNSSLITDLNPDPQGDFSWVEPGSSVWSWWSTSDDAIQALTMRDYINFAAEAGIKYCLVDYGWEHWPNFRTELAELVKYADQKGVGLLVWYGVNKFDQPHLFDLDSADEIEKEFKWCEEIGIKGVKVDYINSDSQFAMNIMYHLADIAAKHHLVLNYHGCTNPNGENRTYPNILSSEAVAGMENYKWSNGSSISTLLTLPYTRNVLGSMEFTPTAYRVSRSNATSGFMLANTIVYESAVQTFAHSAYVYPGYKGLSLLADVPTTWDESRLIEGAPGESVIRARRKGGNWYLGAMTLNAKTYNVPLDFLDDGATYHAYIYSDNAAGDNIEIKTQEVSSKTVLQIPLLANSGCSIKFTKTEPLKTTVFDNYNYYEAEDSACTTYSGEARIADNIYASNLKCVGYVGGAAANTLTFNIPVEDDGEYKLKVYFISGAARDLYIKVNNGNEIACKGLVGKEGDWKAVGATKDITVPLKKGTNNICLYNNTDYTPDIDRIAVTVTPTVTLTSEISDKGKGKFAIDLSGNFAPDKDTEVAITIPDSLADKIKNCTEQRVSVDVNIPANLISNGKIDWTSITLPKEVLEAAMSANKDLTITVNGDSSYQWVFTAEELKSAAITDENLLVEKNSAKDAEVKKALNADEEGMVFTVARSEKGTIPGSVTVSTADMNWKPGDVVNLSYYNFTTQKLEPVSGTYKLDANGNVTIKNPKAGSYVLWKKAASNEEPTVIKVTKLKINKKKLTLGGGEKFTLKVTITPKNATNKKVTWTSSNKKAATVNKTKGVVTAKKVKKAAKTTITAKVDGKKITCAVTVKPAPKKIALNAKSKTLKKGKTFQIKVKKYTPSKAASYKLTYKIDKKGKKVVSVDKKGKIKAKKKGKATITVTTFNKRKATIKITVK